MMASSNNDSNLQEMMQHKNNWQQHGNTKSKITVGMINSQGSKNPTLTKSVLTFAGFQRKRLELSSNQQSTPTSPAHSPATDI